MVAGHARPQGTDTRTRILSAAVGLFAERGYAGTSVRDISERLGVTKAALYYHFSSKETILDALLDPFFVEFGQLIDLARQTPPPPPRLLLERMVALLVGTGGVLCAFANDPSVLHRRMGKDDMISRQDVIVRAVAGPDPTPARLLRARCALGCVQSGILGSAFEKMRQQGASEEVRGGAGGAVAMVTDCAPTTTGVGMAADAALANSFTGPGGTAHLGGVAGPGAVTGRGGAPTADGIAMIGGARPANAPGATASAGRAGGGPPPAGFGVPTALAPLLPEELQHVIVEAALAALGPVESVESVE